ncbi:hypothetical protein [Clostridium beijerinckii]|uniref:hypothetical protein n=1 Tax=Clostridium beijerinckii TaxID=1520 RepID=UPI001360D041|nr:hypothetical protein [Clostridium beijerinckii]MZK49001.1 hypothetical protein [Clostridium beijerinckii]MZK57376.1 hypothetical protein [Clostridium beijerinckii]MZK67587.1 hypothetical protein [Clostridium beijerinckii]MZK72672.1 hypothetical protein [Clostridium beijerinckii]MZK82268.1 hypothetical protein [Clostridium beijerinckii]
MKYLLYEKTYYRIKEKYQLDKINRSNNILNYSNIYLYIESIAVYLFDTLINDTQKLNEREAKYKLLGIFPTYEIELSDKLNNMCKQHNINNEIYIDYAIYKYL